MSRLVLPVALATLLFSPIESAASDRDANIAQTASALASADYARRHCPRIKIDDSVIEENAADADTTVAALREDESYKEQVVALKSVEAQSGRSMVCLVLPAAHSGGYAAGIIDVR